MMKQSKEAAVWMFSQILLINHIKLRVNIWYVAFTFFKIILMIDFTIRQHLSEQKKINF